MSEKADSTQKSGDDDVMAARQEVIDAMATTAEMYGAKRSYGQLYGILYFAQEPQSLDELADRSGYAKSTVSTGMSALERYYLVYRRSLPGEGKRAFFEAERDWWTVVEQVLETEGQREIAAMTRALDVAENHLEGSEQAQADADLERVQELQQYYEQIEQLVDLLSEVSTEQLVSLLELLDANAEPMAGLEMGMVDSQEPDGNTSQ